MKYIISNHKKYSSPTIDKDILYKYAYELRHLSYRAYKLSPLEEIIERRLIKYEVPNKQL